MRKKNKIYVVGPSVGYAKWIDKAILVNSLDIADLVLFTGGEDVTPKLYGQNIHPKTSYNIKRDISEQIIFKKAAFQGIPMLGICRGSQFLTVMNGGELIQDVNNHAGIIHSITFDNGELHEITSTHHQMMFPYNLDKADYKLVAWSTERRSSHHENGDGVDIKQLISTKQNTYCSICRKKMIDMPSALNHNCFKEPEIVFYKKTKSLAVQGHPEMMNEKAQIIKKLNSLIKELLWN